jgi:hypothetical protein
MRRRCDIQFVASMSFGGDDEDFCVIKVPVRFQCDNAALTQSILDGFYVVSPVWFVLVEPDGSSMASTVCDLESATFQRSLTKFMSLNAGAKTSIEIGMEDKVCPQVRAAINNFRIGVTNEKTVY